MAAGPRNSQAPAVCGSKNGPSGTPRTHADFENWTKSDQFRIAHNRAGTGTPIYLGHPEFEGFESVLDLVPAGKAA